MAAYLTSCQTTSGPPIGDLIVAFCTHFIFSKSHKKTASSDEQKFFIEPKTELRAFFTPSAIRGVSKHCPLLVYSGKLVKCSIHESVSSELTLKHQNVHLSSLALYTVSHKKRVALFLIITLAFLGRF